jgi:hypothetical protein
MGTAQVFILIIFILISIPTVGTAWLGYKLIDKLGRFPSKTPAIQMSIMFKLIGLEVVSITLILIFFKIFS